MSARPWNEVEQPDYSHLANPGIAVQQLLKMKARGQITYQQFLELTAEAAGQHEERPITLDSTSAPADSEQLLDTRHAHVHAGHVGSRHAVGCKARAPRGTP